MNNEDDLLRRDIPRSHRQQNKKKDSGRKKRIIIIVAELIILVGLLIFAGYWYIASKFSMMAQEDFDEEKIANEINISDEQLESMKGYWNIACFGLDSRDMGLGAGYNSDVNMVCSINLDSGEIRLVSIFRDTYLNISEKNTYNKINAAYSMGGPTQAVAALNKNLGLNIVDYATFNWKSVADAINILGGIDVELSDAEFYYINAFITETVKETNVYSEHLTKAGPNHLDGIQAVAYGRLRLMDTDYARTERQRIVITKALEKAKAADWATLNNIIETVLPGVSTNIKPEDLIPLAWNIKKFHLTETAGFPFARGEVKNIGKLVDVVVPQTLESNVIQLHEFLFGEVNYSLSDNLKAISSHISDATGLYKAGTPVGHVRTDQGYIPKSNSSKKSSNTGTKKTTKASTTEEDETEESEFLDPPESPEETRPGETAESTTGRNVNNTTFPADQSSASRGAGESSSASVPGTSKAESRPSTTPGARETTAQTIVPGGPGYIPTVPTQPQYPGATTPDTGQTDQTGPGYDTPQGR